LWICLLATDGVRCASTKTSRTLVAHEGKPRPIPLPAPTPGRHCARCLRQAALQLRVAPLRSGARRLLSASASAWLKRKIADGIAEKTRSDLLWQLGTHVLRDLGHHVDSDALFKDRKLDERDARRLRAPRRTLSNDSINKLLITLRAITRTRRPAVGQASGGNLIHA
jgi:hypothetical protein